MSALKTYTDCLVSAEALAAVTGFITWKKWKQGIIKWFVIYLCLIVLLEIGQRINILQSTRSVSNLFMYAVPIEILFINWFFYKPLPPNKKKLVITGAVVYIISWLAENSIFSGAGYYFRSLSYTTGNLFIAIYTILYFIEFVNSNKILDYKKSVVFWIVLGMLVFYVGTFPFYGLYNELAKNLDIFYPVAWVAMSLNYCMYLLFTIGFIWGKPHS